MKKMTNIEMANAIAALDGCNETGKLAYAITRNKRRLEDASKEYMDIRRENLQKYAKERPIGDGRVNYSFVTDDNKPDLEAQKAYADAMADYDNIEHDVDVYTVPLDLFLDSKITNQQMQYLIDWMVDDPDAEADDSEIQNGE